MARSAIENNGSQSSDPADQRPNIPRPDRKRAHTLMLSVPPEAESSPDSDARPTLSAPAPSSSGRGAALSQDEIRDLECASTDLIDARALVEALRPARTGLDDEGTRLFERRLLLPTVTDEEDTQLFETPEPEPAPRPPEIPWSPQSSGVRPIAPRPPTEPPELSDARVVVRSVGAVAAVATGLLQVLGRPAGATHMIATIAMVAALGTAAWLEVVAALYGGLHRRQYLVLVMTGSAAITATVTHLGFSSPLSLALIGLAVALPLWQATVRAVRAERARAQVAFRLAQSDALVEEAQAALAVQRAPRPGRWTGTHVGSHVLGERIGGGDHGEVYCARTAGGDPAAIKIISATHVSDRTFAAAIKASTLAPSIVRVHDFGAVADGSIYLAMELVEGQSIAALLEASGPLPVEVAVEMIAAVGEALHATHRERLAHGNLKATNVVRRGDGRWALLDFGLGAAPHADAAGDVLALAALAYRAIVGCPPFSRGCGRAIRPSALAPVHHDVDCALALGLARDPGTRVESVTAFALALRQASLGRLRAWERLRAHELLVNEPWREPQ